MSLEGNSWSELVEQLNMMVTNFNDLVKASRIPDESVDELSASRERKVPGDLQEVLAEKLLFSAYMCLHHISELKKAAALSDHTTQIGNARAVKSQMQRTEDVIASKIGLIKVEAQELLGQLEESYYSSKFKGRPTESGVSEQLRELCALALETHTGHRK
ncbi:hypothetical protein VOLCADRAFT_107682 [Volvox carteri f. nagariensis]|uniref:Mediator of RNA polymerase II transcription subunit 22 n=1 Tax=Volvox carteri f. nagariensis TaxID=3068 RepID=D8UFL7_VOLCA|nr:uncharacterized protein VOLCADRAFT_107682 [Volvox carteri f. nagariensis]EFJ41480.1 hypothetical protein VOLCADRAFT_107682 [Volvox carteri f. nagariensis]|eukprot:XP_002957425.1 hypothetical protein VOLCADRAFT_107682 [Volvox carteri f. nagariensis]